MLYAELPAKVHVSDQDPRITRGKTAKYGQSPWQLALVMDNGYFCNGSLTSEKLFLTAAHRT